MAILITGGSGFIGAWVIRRLAAAGATLRVFDQSDDRRVVREINGALADTLDWTVGDIADTTAVARAAEGCEGVVHLAGVLTPTCRDNPVRGAQINLIGTLNVFQAAKAQGMKAVVYASSAGVFGPDDGHTPRPTTHYGAFKLACEGSARAFWEDDGIASVGFRPFVVYGPGREGGLSAGPTLACRAAARGQPYVIPFTGSADMLYVDDAAAAFAQAVSRPPEGAHVFNLLGELANVDQVIAGIRQIRPDAELSCEGPPLPIKAEITPDNISAVLPGLPRTSLAAGLEATIAHYLAPH